MKKQFVLTSTILASLAACSSQPSMDEDGWTSDRETAICVNKEGQRIDDDACDDDDGSNGMATAAMWYFIGANSRVPYYGERAYGGSTVRKSGVSYYKAPAATQVTKSQAVSRGGFGSSARASSSSMSAGS